MKESKPATAMPNTGGGKGTAVVSPAHSSTFGGKSAGSKMSVKSGRSSGSKR